MVIYSSVNVEQINTFFNILVFVGDLLWMSYGETSERRATAEV